MAINYPKIRGRVIEKFGTQKKFAEAYGISNNAMSKKMNGKTAISVDDIEKMSKPNLLDISVDEYPSYFFADNVQES